MLGAQMEKAEAVRFGLHLDGNMTA